MQNQRPSRHGWGLASATRQLLDTAEPAEAARRNPQVDRAIAAFLAQPADSPVELNDALADQLLILAHHFGVEESFFTDRGVAEAVTSRRRRGEWGVTAASGARNPAGSAAGIAADSAAGSAAGSAAHAATAAHGAGATRRPRRLAGVALVSVGVLAGAAVGGAVGYRVGTGSGRSEVLALQSARQNAARQSAERQSAERQSAERQSAQQAARPEQGHRAELGEYPAGQQPVGEPMQRIAAHVLPGVVALRVHAGNLVAGGSGIILSPDGLLLTNDHVVAAAAHGGQLTVVLNNGTTRPAHVIGRDPATDIAVVAADNLHGLTPAAVGNSDSVRVGEHVVAVGAPAGQGATGGVVVGATVSRLDHPVVVGHDAATRAPEMLSGFQTDTAVSPASSGGPLVDSRGLVIGVDTVVPSAVTGAAARPGFAIPINVAERVAKHLVGLAGGANTAAGARAGAVGRPVPVNPPPGARIVEPRPVSVSKPTP